MWLPETESLPSQSSGMENCVCAAGMCPKERKRSEPYFYRIVDVIFICCLPTQALLFFLNFFVIFLFFLCNYQQVVKDDK